MSKSILKISLLLGLYCGNSQAMDLHVGSDRAKNFIVAGVVAGLTIQTVKWTFEQERYKQIIPFVKNYPGFALAGLSSVIGIGMLYLRPVASFFNGYSIVKSN